MYFYGKAIPNVFVFLSPFYILHERKKDRQMLSADACLCVTGVIFQCCAGVGNRIDF